jgi:hypothetical protein
MTGTRGAAVRALVRSGWSARAAAVYWETLHAAARRGDTKAARLMADTLHWCRHGIARPDHWRWDGERVAWVGVPEDAATFAATTGTGSTGLLLLSRHGVRWSAVERAIRAGACPVGRLILILAAAAVLLVVPPPSAPPASTVEAPRRSARTLTAAPAAPPRAVLAAALSIT